MIDEIDGSDSVKIEVVITKEGAIIAKHPDALIFFTAWNEMMAKAKREEREEIIAMMRSRGDT